MSVKLQRVMAVVVTAMRPGLASKPRPVFKINNIGVNMVKIRKLVRQYMPIFWAQYVNHIAQKEYIRLLEMRVAHPNL